MEMETPEINANEHLSPEYLRDVLVSVIKAIKVIRNDVTDIAGLLAKPDEYRELLESKHSELTEALRKYEKPADGVSVESASLNGSGELVLSFSDGREVNCGKVTAEAPKAPLAIEPDIQLIVAKVLSFLDENARKTETSELNAMVAEAVAQIELPTPSQVDETALQTSLLAFINSTPESIGIESIKGFNQAIEYLLHQYRASFVTASSGGGAVASVNGYTGVVVLVKADVGLGNVDNTSDLAKPISTATQTALNTKVAKAGDVMSGELDIVYDYPTFKVKNSSTAQYSGAGFFLINNATSMANQAGVTHYMGINDVAATQGFYAIDKTNVAGGGTGHLLLFDFNADSLTFYTNNTPSVVVDTLGNTYHRGRVSTETILLQTIAPLVSSIIPTGYVSTRYGSYEITGVLSLELQGNARLAIL